jgi:hypothetical protein
MKNQIHLQSLPLISQNNRDGVQNLFQSMRHSFTVQEEIGWTAYTSGPWTEFFPLETAGQETLLIAFLYVALFFHLDNHKGENFEEICDKYLEILEGGISDENDGRISYALFDFMQKLSEQDVSVRGFIEWAKKVINVDKWKHNNRQTNFRVDLRTYQNIRSFTINVYPWWELWQILGGDPLTTAEKNMPDVQRFLELAATVMYLAMDLHSLGKDRQNGELNYVSLLSDEGGIPDADAFHLTRILLHQRKMEFAQIHEQISVTHNNQNLHRFVAFVKRVIEQGLDVLEKNSAGKHTQEQYNIDAFAKGLSFLTEIYKQNRFQSFISSTPDMSTPVECPETLFPGLAEFPSEIFTPMMITDLVFKDKPELKIYSDLVNEVKSYQSDDGVFTFWNDYSLIPADIDDTGIGLTILVEAGKVDLSIVHQVVDRILNNTSEDGIFRVYFPPYGHRSYVDPVVCVNALSLFALLGREKEAQKTEDYVFEYLRTKAYLKGTRMYASPDIFLYYMARLIDKSTYYRERFEDHIRQELQTRIGTTHQPMDLAARVITAKAVSISNDLEESYLILFQNSNGGWPANSFFEFHRRHGHFGCEALTTAFAVKALETKALYEQTLSRYDYKAIYETHDTALVRMDITPC